MSRIRLSVLGALVVFVVGAIAASSASAAFVLTATNCEGTVVTACYATTNEGATLFEFSGEEATSAKNVAGQEVLLQAILGEEVHIVCTASSATGTLVQPAALAGPVTEAGGVITFTGCSLLEPLAKKCKVPAELKTKAIKATFPTTGETEYSAEGGTIFIEIPFTNNGTETCPATIKGTQPVTGTQKCTNVEPEVDRAEGEQKCEEGGSNLKLGGSAAKFLLVQKVKLVNATDDFWSISKG